MSNSESNSEKIQSFGRETVCGNQCRGEGYDRFCVCYASVFIRISYRWHKSSVIKDWKHPWTSFKFILPEIRPCY